MRSTATCPSTRYLVGHGGKEVAVAAALPTGRGIERSARELGLHKPE